MSEHFSLCEWLSPAIYDRLSQPMEKPLSSYEILHNRTCSFFHWIYLCQKVIPIWRQELWTVEDILEDSWGQSWGQLICTTLADQCRCLNLLKLQMAYLRVGWCCTTLAPHSVPLYEKRVFASPGKQCWNAKGLLQNSHLCDRKKQEITEYNMRRFHISKKTQDINARLLANRSHFQGDLVQTP